MRPNPPPENPLDYRFIGYNVRCLRMAVNKTQGELAHQASVGVSTLRRLERGSPIHLRNLKKIGSALGKTVEFLAETSNYGTPEQDRRVVIHRSGDLKWFASMDRRRSVPPDSQERIQRQEERLRLARTGLVTMFEAYTVIMPYGPSVSMAEICGVWTVAPHEFYHSAILFCMRGELTVKLGKYTYSLSEGDGIGFEADQPATVEPQTPISPDGAPPLVWFVMGNRRGYVPIEFKERRRKRIRHLAADPPRTHQESR